MPLNKGKHPTANTPLVLNDTHAGGGVMPGGRSTTTMPAIKIRLTVPIPVGRGASAPGLTFSRWLPLEGGDAIQIDEVDISVRLAFRIESVWWATQPTVDDLPGTTNVLAHRIFADVVAEGLAPELIDYIQRCDLQHHAKPEDAALQAGYDQLAERVLTVVLSAINGLIAVVRSRKGQYWLSEYEIDLGRSAEMCNEFEAQASVNGFDWFRFRPSNIIRMSISLGDEERYIRRGEWQAVREAVESRRRPPLAGALLAGAESLAAHGQSRSALTEAVAALEVALYAFARSPAAERVFGASLAKRLGVTSLYHQVEHMGLSASVRYLLPILLPEPVLSEEVLRGCRNAIEQRNTVVHQGQREVSDRLLKESLKTIRALCRILDELSMSNAEDVPKSPV